MKTVATRADVQVWVCVNARAPGAPLPSCSRERGDALAELLRAELTRVAVRGGHTVWVNRTLCQGFCHAQGVTVTVEFSGSARPALKFQGVEVTDVAALAARVGEELRPRA